MLSSSYQLIALGARYLFVFLALLIVLRAGLSLLSEHRRRKKKLRNLPDAGMVGEMRDTDNDRAYPLPREGTLGSGRGCDIRLKGLRRRHVNFSFVEGKGLLLTPCHSRSEVLLNNAPIQKGGYALHGALMQVGGYTLRVRLFAGLNVPRAASFQEHFQPVYGEDLYAPDPWGLTPVMPYDAVPPPVMEAPDDPLPPYPTYESAPIYQSAPPVSCQPWQQPMLPPEEPLPEDEDDPLPFDSGMYAPKPAEEEEFIMAPPRVRHRRSERNRNV